MSPFNHIVIYYKTRYPNHITYICDNHYLTFLLFYITFIATFYKIYTFRTLSTKLELETCKLIKSNPVLSVSGNNRGGMFSNCIDGIIHIRSV